LVIWIIILTFVKEILSMDIVLLKKDSVEWVVIWDILAKHPINDGLDEPKIAYNDGESWQYMASYKQGDNVIHEFRHKKHPKTNDVYRVNFNNKVSDNSIEKIIKVK